MCCVSPSSLDPSLLFLVCLSLSLSIKLPCPALCLLTRSCFRLNPGPVVCWVSPSSPDPSLLFKIYTPTYVYLFVCLSLSICLSVYLQDSALCSLTSRCCMLSLFCTLYIFLPLIPLFSLKFLLFCLPVCVCLSIESPRTVLCSLTRMLLQVEPFPCCVSGSSPDPSLLVESLNFDHLLISVCLSVCPQNHCVLSSAC